MDKTLAQDIQENPTVFGKILRDEIPAKKVYEDEHILAFHDIAPAAKVHVLVIPKKRILSAATCSDADKAILGHLHVKISEIAKMLGVDETGFRVISNAGTHAGQEVPHLHYHLLGGNPLGPMLQGRTKG